MTRLSLKTLFPLVFITVFFSFISLINTAQAADNLSVIASVDKNPVSLYDSVVLTVLANDDINPDALNLSALQNDFTLARTSVSTESRSVNFKSTQLTRWTTVITPKKAGTYIIPALTIESLQTKPIAIKVLATSNAKDAQRNKDVFVEASVSIDQGYVQQVFSLSIKLFINTQTQLNRATLTEPSMPGAEITAIKDDKESEEIINGKRYRVIERLYSVSPQQSGDFELVTPRFSGSMVVPASNNRGGFYRQSKPVNTGTKNIQVQIQPIPSAYKGSWLPSDIVTLHQEWQPDMATFKVGEPITRIITLNVKGVSKEQLPLLDFTVPKGLKVYPDKAERHASATSRGFVSQQVRSFAIVANKAGNYTLPAVSIPWWNTVTHRLEYAKLPAQKITVAVNDDADIMTNSQQYTAFSNNGLVNENGDCAPLNETSGDIIGTTDMNNSNDFQKWLYLTLWLATVLAWGGRSFLNKRQREHRNNTNNTNNITEGSPNKAANKVNLTAKNQQKLLLTACKNDQADIAHKNILPWLKSLCNDAGADINTISSIDEAIAVLNNNALTHAVNTLQQALYGAGSSLNDSIEGGDKHWSGAPLVKLINELKCKNKVDKPSKSNFTLNP